nr:DNA repair protein RAD51 homolog 4 [Haemonchus contortus]
MSEIVGDSGAGKTQLCYAIVANTLIHTKFNVAWLDSNGSYRSHRLVELINGRGINDADVVSSLLDRICVARVSDQTQLLDALEFIDDKMETNNFRLVVIDSVFEMFDDRQLDENMTRSTVFNSILCRIGILTDIGCTVLVTSSASEGKNDLNKAWTRQMKSRILVKESDGLRTLHNLNLLLSRRSAQCDSHKDGELRAKTRTGLQLILELSGRRARYPLHH